MATAGYKAYRAYPPTWLSVIRKRILDRDNHQCRKCHAKEHAILPNGKMIVLTIAHLDHDPLNWKVKDARLTTLCQKCHLSYDRQRNWLKRKIKWQKPPLK